MKKCSRCKKTFDDSWGVCLFCGDLLRAKHDHSEDMDDVLWKYSPHNKFLIITYSILLMVLVPLLLFFFYLTYFRLVDLESVTHARQQSGEAVVFDEEEKPKDR